MIRTGVKAQLVAFLVLSLVTTAILSARFVGLTERLLGNGPTVAADFSQSGGIFVGSEVSYRGVQVGRVTELELLPDGVRVRAELRDGTEIPKDTRVVVENRSAVGEQYLDFQPQRVGGPYLGDGDVVPRSRTGTPLPVENLLQHLDDTVASVDRDDLRTVTDELGLAFASGGRDLQRLLDSGDALTRSATEALPETIRLIDDGRIVLDTQRDTGGQVVSFARNLELLSRSLKASDSDLRVVLDRGAVASRELDALVRENQEDLGVLVANLVTVGQVTTANHDGLRQILITYPYVVEGGFTVLPGDGTAHFGLVTSNEPQPCRKGYGGTERTQPSQVSDLPPVNTKARCALPRGSAATVRGAQNAPRPGGATGTASRAAAYDTRTYALSGNGALRPVSWPDGRRGTYAAPAGPVPGSAHDGWSWIVTTSG